MKKLDIEILTPESEFLMTEADSIIFTCADGYYGILPSHSPITLTLESGFIDITNDGVKDRIWASEGIATVINDKVLVFVNLAADTEEGLSPDEMKHFAMMQREKESIYQHRETKIALTRTITGLTRKKHRNI